ncbi:MAG: D-2-hydroxyacid dehydrogenase [Ktedonobacteraceae bacterium]
MQKTATRLVLVRIEITEQWQQRLRQVSPELRFEFRADDSTGNIPADLWREVEILYMSGSHFPTPEQAPALRWVQLFSAGANQALTQPLFKSDVIFTTSSGVHSVNIGEYVITALLSWYHRMPQLQELQRKSEWLSQEQFGATMMPEELRDKTLGIVGYGSIGREVARLARTFGMRILAMQQSSDHRDHGFMLPGIGDPEGSLPERYYTASQLHDMLKECDAVVLAVPLTPQTRNLFDADAFKAMKADAFLVNIARGDVCDEEALLAALRQKQIAGAALDVFKQEPLPADNPFWQLPNVIVSPHYTGLTPHYTDRAMQIFEANLRRYLAGETLYNQVDKAKGY